MNLDFFPHHCRTAWSNYIASCRGSLTAEMPALQDVLAARFAREYQAQLDKIEGSWLYVQFPDEERLMEFLMRWG